MQARRGSQIFSRRWISYAWLIPFSATEVGSSSTPTSRSDSGSGKTKRASST
jgi:hypothetical protein